MADPITFDDTLNKLAETVRQLEKGDLSLDDALSTFETGMTLSASAHEQLTAAQDRINKLSQGADGIIQTPLPEPQDD